MMRTMPLTTSHLQPRGVTRITLLPAAFFLWALFFCFCPSVQAQEKQVEAGQWFLQQEGHGEASFALLLHCSKKQQSSSCDAQNLPAQLIASSVYVPGLDASRALLSSAPWVGGVWLGRGLVLQPQWLQHLLTRASAASTTLWLRIAGAGLMAGYLAHRVLQHGLSDLEDATIHPHTQNGLIPETPSSRPPPHNLLPHPPLSESKDESLFPTNNFHLPTEKAAQQQIQLHTFLAELSELSEEVSEALELMSKGFKQLQRRAGTNNTKVQQMELLVRGGLFQNSELRAKDGQSIDKSFEELGLKLDILARNVGELRQALPAQNAALLPLPRGLEVDRLKILQQQLTVLGGSLAGIRGRLIEASSDIEDPRLRGKVRGFVRSPVSFTHLAFYSKPSSSQIVIKLSALAGVLAHVAWRTEALQRELTDTHAGVLLGYPATLRYRDHHQSLQLSTTMLALHLRLLRAQLEEREFSEAELALSTDEASRPQERQDFYSDFDMLLERLREQPGRSSADLISEYESTAAAHIARIYHSSFAQKAMELSVLLEALQKKIGLDHDAISAHAVAWDQLSPAARRHLILSWSYGQADDTSFIMRSSAQILRNSLMLQMVREKAHQESPLFPLLSDIGATNFYRYDRLFYELSLPQEAKHLPLGSITNSQQELLARFLHNLDAENQELVLSGFDHEDSQNWDHMQDFRTISHRSSMYRLSNSSRIFITALPYIENLVATLEELLPHLVSVKITTKTSS